MARLFLQWFLSAGALLLVANLFSGVQVHSLSSALWAALILGLLNAVLRPVLVVLTLPVTLVTLGLFLLVTPTGSKHWRLKYHFLCKERLFLFFIILTLESNKNNLLNSIQYTCIKSYCGFCLPML